MSVRGALGRVARAPELVLFAAVLQWALAALFAAPVRSAVGANLGKFAVVADGGFLAAVIELMFDHPGLLAGFQHVLAGSAVFAVAFWTLSAVVVIRRLRGPARASELAAQTVRQLPAVIATTLWHLPLRALVLVPAVALAARPLDGSWVGLAVVFAALAVSTCALDLARCRVVLGGAPGFHAATALAGFTAAVRRPRVLIPSLLFSLVQWACLAAMLAVAIDGAAGGATIWLVRALSVLALVAGLARIAVAVDA